MEEEFEEEEIRPLEPTEAEVEAILNDDSEDEPTGTLKRKVSYDSCGFITDLLIQQGLLPKDIGRITPGNIGYCGYFVKIPWKFIKKGDILCKNEEHMVLYEGDNMIIHASNELPYPHGGVLEEELNFVGEAYRIKRYGVE